MMICLTGEPEGECRSLDSAKINYEKIAVCFSQERDGYFLFDILLFCTLCTEINTILMLTNDILCSTIYQVKRSKSLRKGS